VLSAARWIEATHPTGEGVRRLCVLDRVIAEPDIKGFGPGQRSFGFFNLSSWSAELRRIKERYITTLVTIDADEVIGQVASDLCFAYMAFAGLGSFKSGIDIEAKGTAKWTPCSLVYPLSQRGIPCMPSIGTLNHYALSR
jgi:hypothetical protein